ncbi:hypothetical protein CBM2605_B150088 [Cupriavidus neocaledonicus]|nr:hypothetical protein CBM2605_B150088 [Cupriavidus neocaledonicus]
MPGVKAFASNDIPFCLCRICRPLLF